MGQNDGLVASRMLSERALQQLLVGEQGQDWLSNGPLRRASVSFLVSRQRFSHLDTAELRLHYDAFISFPNDDRPVVLELVQALTGAGIKVFFDGHITPGVRWAEFLSDSFSASRNLIYCIGSSSSTAEGQRHELLSVISQGNFPVVPVILPGATPPLTYP